MHLVLMLRNRQISKLKNQGFTLIELLIVVSILGIVVITMAVNSRNAPFQDWNARQRLRSAAEQFMANCQQAKIAAIRDNSTVTITQVPADAACPGGSYLIASPVTVVANVCVSANGNDNVSIASWGLPAAAGFTSRALVTNGALAGLPEDVVFINADLTAGTDPIFVVNMTVSGNLTMTEDTYDQKDTY